MAPQSLKHNGTDTHMNSQRLCQHTQDSHKFKSDVVPSPRGESRRGVPTLTKKPSVIPAGKGKISLLQRSITEYINHTPGEAPMPKSSQLTQDKFHSFLWRRKRVILFCFGNFALLVIFVLVDFFQKGDRDNIKLLGQRDGEDLGRVRLGEGA